MLHNTSSFVLCSCFQDVSTASRSFELNAWIPAMGHSSRSSLFSPHMIIGYKIGSLYIQITDRQEQIFAKIKIVFFSCYISNTDELKRRPDFTSEAVLLTQYHLRHFDAREKEITRMNRPHEREKSFVLSYTAIPLK